MAAGQHRQPCCTAAGHGTHHTITLRALIITHGAPTASKQGESRGVNQAGTNWRGVGGWSARPNSIAALLYVQGSSSLSKTMHRGLPKSKPSPSKDAGRAARPCTKALYKGTKTDTPQARRGANKQTCVHHTSKPRACMKTLGTTAQATHQCPTHTCQSVCHRMLAAPELHHHTKPAESSPVTTKTCTQLHQYMQSLPSRARDLPQHCSTAHACTIPHASYKSGPKAVGQSGASSVICSNAWRAVHGKQQALGGSCRCMQSYKAVSCCCTECEAHAETTHVTAQGNMPQLAGAAATSGHRTRSPLAVHMVLKPATGGGTKAEDRVLLETTAHPCGCQHPPKQAP